MLSVLIPAYNEAALLPRALASLRASFKEAGISDWEIVVCDNNSADDTARIAREAGARVVFEPHNQISRARNRAAAEAKGEWFLFLDADTQVSPALLGAMAEKIRQGVAGGGAEVSFDGPVGRVGTLATAFWNWLSRRFSLAAGCFIFCRREAWAAAGGFDEKLYASEEIRFSLRVGRWGKSLGQPFVILESPKVVSSARKFSMFSRAQMARMVLILAIPGAIRFRRFCRLWYHRPPQPPTPPGAGAA